MRFGIVYDVGLEREAERGREGATVSHLALRASDRRPYSHFFHLNARYGKTAAATMATRAKL